MNDLDRANNSSSPVTIWIDGAAESPFGCAAAAFHVEFDEETIHAECRRIGDCNSAIAEWTALMHALNWAHRVGLERIIVATDSNDVFCQFQEQTIGKTKHLRRMAQQAKALASSFQLFHLKKISREKNRIADRLAARVLRARAKKRGAKNLQGEEQQ